MHFLHLPLSPPLKEKQLFCVLATFQFHNSACLPYILHFVVLALCKQKRNVVVLFLRGCCKKTQIVDLVQFEMKITNIKIIWNLLDPIRKRFNWSFQLSIGEKWRNQNTRNILVTAETFAQIHFSWKRWSWMKGALKDGETPFHCFFSFNFQCAIFLVIFLESYIGRH